MDTERDDDLPQDDEPRNPLRDHVRSLEQKLDELTKANAELARTNAFLAAGVNPAEAASKPMIRYFVAGYDGDLTPEAIREAAVAAGIITPSGVSHKEKAAVDRIDETASAGASKISGVEAEVLAIKSAKTPEELREVIRQINASRSS